MSIYEARVRNIAAILAAFVLTISPLAGAEKSADLAKIRINNFGRMNENYYRGAQPRTNDYKDLAAIGVKTVIDLTKDGRSDERGLVERAGMTFYRIPMTTSDRPSEVAVKQFLQLVNDPANWPVFVHCQGGRHRTGAMTALYRMTKDGWTADRAFAEMKQYRFEGFIGHPELKRFVYAYYSDMVQARQPAPTRKAVGGGN